MRHRKYIYILFTLMALVATDKIIGFSFYELENVLLNYPTDYQTITNFTINKVNTDVVIIGASTARHHYIPNIIEDSTKFTVYNCGMDGNFFLYQNAVINCMLDRYSPKIIIWDIDANCLSNHREANEYERLSELNSFYNTHEYCKQLINKRNPFEKYKMLSDMYRYNSKLLGYLEVLMGYGEVTQNGFINSSKNQNKFPGIKEKILENNISEERKKMLENTIEKCKSNSVELFFVTSPKLLKSNYKNTTQYISLVQIIKTSGFNYSDYYESGIFISDSTLFKDNTHLNNNGAKVFSSLIGNQLKKQRLQY